MSKTKRLLIIIVVLVFAYAIIAYFYNKVTENKYIEQCSQRDSIENMSIGLVGFDSKEARTIDVFEKQNGTITDSFWVTSNWYLFKEDTSAKAFTIDIRRPLKIKNEYVFVVNKQDTFLLSDMVMSIVLEHSMLRASPFCEFAQCKVNGKLHAARYLTFNKKERK